nr:MAG TPA_asm: hypothetical protein [Caudoviricetes sp.]
MIVDTKNSSPRLTPWAFSYLHNRKEHSPVWGLA